MADKFKTTPTYNPAAKENLGLALQHLVKYVSTNLECSIPAKIVKYDRTTHVATVQPLVKIQYPDGDQVKSEERQQFDVTVLQFCHGGFVIDIPLSEGDTGWVVASDRDAVLAKKANANIKAADNKGAQDPNTSQKHRYNLGFFIPDSWATIPYDMEKFDGKMVIGDVENIDDPAAYITLDHDGHIVIHADKEVIFETELITFDCNVHIKKNLEVDGDSLLHGNLKVEGKDNKINDMTEQEIKFFSDVVKKDGKTYLVLSKTNVLRSDLEKVDEIEFKGGSEDNPDDPGGGGEDPDKPDDPTGGGGGGSVNNVVAWVPFVCRRKEEGDSSVEYFLPEHTARVDDQVVDFTTNFPASDDPGWRTSSETNNSGTIFCTINKKSDRTFVGHFTNAAVQIGTVDDDEEVMYCFAVCKIDGSIGDGKILDGITQYAAGEMVFKEKTVHTPFGIETIDGVKTITNGVFYWNNEIIEVDDLEVPDSDTVYLVVSRELPDGEWTAELDTEEGESDDEIECYSFKLYDFEDGEVSTDYRTTFLALGASKTRFKGDADGSEEIIGENGLVLFTGHPGTEDEQGQDSHSGIMFLTVSERTGDNGEKIPAKIIVRIKDKEETEDWGAKTMTITDKNGNEKIVHFLGCDDVDLDFSDSSGGGGGGVENAIGSDYIEVNDVTETDSDGNTTTKRKIEAKVATPANQGNAANPNALVTHNTNQFIRCIKTFLGLGIDNNLKKVVIDGPNGKIEVKNAAGNRMIKLDSGDIPNECGQGGATTIQVRKLTINHPRAKNNKTSDIYHVLACSDMTIDEGDAISKVEAGESTQSNGYTITPVTITLKDGTELPAFNIKAKNGSDGESSDGDDGDDAGLTVSVTTHQPTASDPRTGVDVVLTPTINGVAQTPSSFTIYNGDQGVGIGSIELDETQSSERTRYYNVMSDEETPQLLGTLSVTDGRSIGSVVLKSTNGKTKTYSVMSDDSTPVEIGTFSVTDGEDGDDGDDASIDITTSDIVPTASDPRTGKTITFTPYTGSNAGTPVSVSIHDGLDGGVVGSINGDASGSQSLNGVITVKGKQGSGLVVKTTRTAGPTAQHPLADGTLEIDFAGRENLSGCSKNFGLHELKYKDNNGDVQIYHVFSCGDIDLTKEGKLIKETKVTASADPGGINILKFTYTDGTYDEFKIANGLDGQDGSPGKDGDTPEITAERQGNHIYIYADGNLVATLEDGHTPQITAQKVGKITTIYADGNPIATINDGEGTEEVEAEEIDVITGLSFSTDSSGNIIANITKKRAKVVSVIGSESTTQVTALTVTKQNVITHSEYSNSTHVFKNTVKEVAVIGSPVDQTDEDVFTATSIAEEV